MSGTFREGLLEGLSRRREQDGTIKVGLYRKSKLKGVCVAYR